MDASLGSQVPVKVGPKRWEAAKIQLHVPCLCLGRRLSLESQSCWSSTLPQPTPSLCGTQDLWQGESAVELGGKKSHQHAVWLNL